MYEHMHSQLTSQLAGIVGTGIIDQHELIDDIERYFGVGLLKCSGGFVSRQHNNDFFVVQHD
jgi:hypothetical protein